MLLLFTPIKLYSLGLLSCESVVVFANYGLGYCSTSRVLTLDMLTITTMPLSNPSRPRSLKEQAQS